MLRLVLLYIPSICREFKNTRLLTMDTNVANKVFSTNPYTTDNNKEVIQQGTFSFSTGILQTVLRNSIIELRRVMWQAGLIEHMTQWEISMCSCFTYKNEEVCTGCFKCIVTSYGSINKIFSICVICLKSYLRTNS